MLTRRFHGRRGLKTAPYSLGCCSFRRRGSDGALQDRAVHFAVLRL